jgi:E3 ubiquitin-protein ligase TRIP12
MVSYLLASAFTLTTSGLDGSRVEAQTPGGTGVGTPGAARTSPAAARSISAGKASYAAALKAKPTDWHLEFEMDDNVLPLDLTIYGAIHQHQIRKTGSSSVSPTLIWQGIHTIKFKKVVGPAPGPEGGYQPFQSERL